jgi:hypothetical protein
MHRPGVVTCHSEIERDDGSINNPPTLQFQFFISKTDHVYIHVYNIFKSVNILDLHYLAS